ncbi:MAG: fluoride efflux transporter CrcB [Alphaproteobacteria bacterium]|nr:fluoride efflux transporter CrcB [Alphaproteobacteria bacterium]
MFAFALVGAGGAIGAMGRFGLGLLGAQWGGSFPLATFVTNIIGSLLMGVLMAVSIRELSAIDPSVRLFLGIGVLGGFTTFSAFSLETVQMIQRGAVGLAITYALASVVISVSALFVGYLLIRGVSG